MKVNQYAEIMRRWLWLILLATGIAAGTSYFATQQMPKIYQTSTVLLVGQSLQNPNPSSELLNVSQQLAQTYAQIATTDPVLQNALYDLGIAMATDQLRAQVNARNVAGTALIEIRVVDTDPLRSQALANELGRQLVLQSPAAKEQSDPQREFVQKQLDEIQRNIEEAQPKMKDLEGSIKLARNSIEIEEKQRELDAFQYQIGVWQQTYAGFLNYLAPRAANYVSVIDPARLPARPIAPNVPLYIFSSSAIGMLFAVCGVFIIAHLDEIRKIS